MVLSQSELRFRYRKRTEDGALAEPEERHVQPRCLVCVEHAWYVIADDPIRGGKSRTFALFRMLSARDTGRPFTPVGPFDLDAVLADSLGIHTGGPVAPVELRFHPSVAGYAREHSWHDTEAFAVLPDQYLRLTMTVALNPELQMKIQRWGSKVEVVGPPELREKFANYTLESMRLYHPGHDKPWNSRARP